MKLNQQIVLEPHMNKQWWVLSTIIFAFFSSAAFTKSRLYIHNNTDTVLNVSVRMGERKLSSKHWKFGPREIRPYQHVSVLRVNRRTGLKRNKYYHFEVTLVPTNSNRIDPDRTSVVPFVIRLKLKRIVGKKRMYYSYKKGHVISKWTDSKKTSISRWGKVQVKYRKRRGVPDANVTFVFTAPDRRLFRFPIEKRSRISSVRGPYFYDMRETKGDVKNGRRFKRLRCKNYKNKGTPNCYGGHTGTDYMLKGGFRMMGKRKNYIVAARNGKVEYVRDCYFDRCRLSNCYGKNTDKDGNKRQANYIQILHDDGTRTRYFHLKKNSAMVGEDEYVRCGQRIARIGSSGISVAPHLHFVVQVKSGTKHPFWHPIDPFKGKLTGRTFWHKSGSTGFPSSQCASAASQPYASLVPDSEPDPNRALKKSCTK